MASKKRNSSNKTQGLFNNAEKSFIIDKLKEKYIRRSSVTTPVTENDRVSLSSRMGSSDRESSQIFSKKPNFHDVVLRAARHKPFRENIDVKSQRRLSNLGHENRLANFRQVASRWRTKTKKASKITESLPESDFETDLPEKPRFCATLSTEAQYAIFKGYEDALVTKISSLSTSEGNVAIQRVPSANIKTKPQKERTSPFTILEIDKPTIVLVSSVQRSDEYLKESSTEDIKHRDHDLRFMSAHFKQAMNLLDEIKRNSYIEPKTDETDVAKPSVTMERNIQQFHAWSQQWAKNFDFSCS